MRRRIYSTLGFLLALAVRRLPDRAMLLVKANTAMVRKMDYRRHSIFLNIESKVEYDVRLHSCSREPETVMWIHDFFKPGDIFFDIGANVGAYSLVASKFGEGKIKVYAFEPGFMTFPQLCKNVLTNECQDSIVPLQIALSDKTGIEVFNYDNLNIGGALHALGEPIDYKGDVFTPVAKQPVASYRIDDLIQNFGIPVPNHIKIDVDGIELAVLKGADNTLRSSSLKSVILELEEGDEEGVEIAEFLRERGLEFRSKQRYEAGGDQDPFSNVYNYIFVRRASPGENPDDSIRPAGPNG